MSKQIINTWGEKKPYTVEKPIYVNGEYAIYKQFDKCYLYTYKNVAIGQLAGVNKAIIDALAIGERPTNPFSRPSPTLKRKVL